MKTTIPLGDRLLVRRRIIGEKLGKEGIIIAPDDVQDAKTDLADVIYVPEHSFADKVLIEQAEEIIQAQTEKAKKGDPEALKALLTYNAFLKIKAIQPGDCVLMSKYVGTTIEDNKGGGEVTIVRGDDIIGIVKDL